MDLNNFDKDLIDKIQNHKVSLDKEELWQGINKKRKKKRRFLFLMPFLLLGVAALFYLSESAQDNFQGEYFQESETVAISEAASKEESSIIAETTQSIDKTTEDQNNKDLGVFTSENEAKENSTAQLSKPVAITPSKSKHAKIRTQQSNTKVTQTEHPFTKQNFNSKKTIINQTIAQEYIRPIEQTFTQASDSENETSIVVEQLEIGKFSLLDNDGLQALTKKAYAFSPDFVTLPKVFEKTSNRNKFSVSLAGGYGYAFRTLESVIDNSQIQAYADLRNTAETTLDEFTLELGFTYNISDNFYLRSGAQFAQIAERFLHVDEYENEVTETGTVLQIIGPDPEMIQNISGMLVGTQTVRDNYAFYNQYQFLDIPIALGYRKNQGKLGFGIEAGVLANLSLDFGGHLYDINANVIEPENYFKDRLSLRYTVGLPIDYALGEHVRLFARPSFVFSNENILNELGEIIPLKQSYNIARLQLGIDYAF